MYSCTGHKHTELWEAFGGHFGPFVAELGPIWRPHRKIWVTFGSMSSVLAAKKGLIALLSGPEGQTINIQ